MAWTPISNAVIQYSKDAAGTSASGYYLKFYQPGTSTPFSMASASDGTGLLAKCQINSLGYPINGSGDVFIPYVDQDYRLVLYTNSTDADANTFASAVFDVDGISPLSDYITKTELAAAGGAGLVGYKADFAAAALRDVESKLNDVIHLTDVTGADPTGATDSTAAFNSAIAEGREIVLPAGTFTLSESSGSAAIRLQSNLKIRGAGMGRTILKRVAGDANFSRLMYGTGVSNIIIEDLTIDSNRDEQDAGFEHQHGFMVTWDGVNGSENIYLNRVEIKNTVGDTFFFHLKSKNCHMLNCISDNPLRVGANVGFLDGGSIVGCTFKNQKTNGIKTEPNDPGDISRNILIMGNHFSSDWALGSGVGGVTLGSPTTAICESHVIVGNTFKDIDVPVLLSKAVKGLIVDGNTMNNCLAMVRALSYTAGLGDIQESITVSDNVGFNMKSIGTSDQYMFAFYNAKNIKVMGNTISQASGGAIARMIDIRESRDVKITDNKFEGDCVFTCASFFRTKKIKFCDNEIIMNDATKDIVSIDNGVGYDLERLRIYNNDFDGTYRYGLNISAADEANVVYESGNIYGGTFTAKRFGATAAKYVSLLELGNYSISSGVGAPSGAPLGDRGIYIDETGGTTTTLYIWEGASWVAK